MLERQEGGSEGYWMNVSVLGRISHMEKLINMKNEWDDCIECAKVESPVSVIDFEGRDSSKAQKDR